jgi:glucokinase
LELVPQVYPTAEYDTFEDALDALYSEEVLQRHPPQSAALAVAGPVINNCCKMTNLKWVIDGQELTQRRGIL